MDNDPGDAGMRILRDSLFEASRFGELPKKPAEPSNAVQTGSIPKMDSGMPVAEVQMLSFLLDARQLKPRGTIGHKLHPLHERGSNCIALAASDLRRQRQKEFVHSFCRQKLCEQCRPTLVEEHSYPKLRVQQLQDRRRSDAATTRIQSMDLNESNFIAPRRVSSSLPAEVVITTVHTPGVRSSTIRAALLKNNSRAS